MPEKGKHKDMLADLDDQAKEKAKSIFEQEKSGELTHEQAKRINKVRCETSREKKHEDIFVGLDEATKTKAKAILDNEKKQLEACGASASQVFMNKEDK